MSNEIKRIYGRVRKKVRDSHTTIRSAPKTECERLINCKRFFGISTPLFFANAPAAMQQQLTVIPFGFGSFINILTSQKVFAAHFFSSVLLVAEQEHKTSEELCNAFCFRRDAFPAVSIFAP